MPPPSCTGSALAARIRSTTVPLTERPAMAPFRSTTWIASNPCSTKRVACSTGSVLKTVARFISPRTRRTHTPSFRSMAG